jgi:hypothetical protein
MERLVEQSLLTDVGDQHRSQCYAKIVTTIDASLEDRPGRFYDLTGTYRQPGLPQCSAKQEQVVGEPAF